MLDELKIVHTNAQPTAVIRFTIPRAEIQKVMGPAIGEVIACVTSQGVGPAGPVFSHHFAITPDTFDFEVGVPVSSPVKATGRVQPGELPATTVARTVYRGPYEGLGTAWAEFISWITAAGHTPATDLWECYVSGPESSPDPTNWRTEFNRPLIATAR